MAEGAPMRRTSRRGAIDPFIVMEMMRAANARAARGAEVLHLEVGEPGEGAPTAVIEAAEAALRTGRLSYTEAVGEPALRARIARHYHECYGLQVPVERIVVTPGASGAFVLAFLAAFDAGARVAMGEPGYPAYRNILGALDCVPVPIATAAAERFQPTATAIAAVEAPLDGVILASPANPTGTSLSAAELAAIAGAARGRGLRVVADEIYHGLSFGEPAACALASMPDAIIVNSFSKYFGMTGWRLGWLVLPADLVEPVTRLAQNLFIAPSTIAQRAAIAAFDARPELDRRVAHYRRNRDRLLAGLEHAGLAGIVPPDGAFYLYVDVARFGLDSATLCERLLEQTGVAATPGIDFDPTRGRDFIRLSFAADEVTIGKAAERLSGWFAEHHRA